MGDLRTVRWTRNDDDRLYVMQADGIQVGWVDLMTGERHLVAPAMRAEVDAALSAYAEAIPGLPVLLTRGRDATAEAQRPVRDDGGAADDASRSDPDGGGPTAHGMADVEPSWPRPDPSTTRLGAWWRDGWR